MILHLVKCEMCDSQYQFNPLQKPAEGHVSETWFTLFKSKDMQGQAGWDFCSKACLMRWASPLSDHEPYPYCCIEYYPMSLTKQEV